MSFIIFWIFVAFALGCVEGYLFSFPLLLLFLLAAVFLLGAVFLLKRSKLLLFDILIVGVFFFGGLMRATEEKNLQSSCYELLGERTFLIQPQEKSREYKTYNLYRVVLLGTLSVHPAGGQFWLDNGWSRGRCMARWKDYSRSSLTLFDIYLLKAKLKITPSVFSFLPCYKFTLYSRKVNKPLLFRHNFSLYKIAAKISSFLEHRLSQNFSFLTASFIKAVFLGKKDICFNNLRHIFVKAGTAHILAISGLHVGIVAGVVLFILKIMRFNYAQRTIIAVPLILFYAFICSLRPPVLRAALFYGYFAFSFYLRRRPSLFCALALAGLVDLLFRPYDIFSLSFQLSFSGVFFILVGFKYFYPSSAAGGGALAWGRKLFFLSLFVSLGIWPLLSFYFGKVYFLNIFVNIIDIPFLGVILTAIIVYFSFAFGILAVVFGRSLEFLVELFVKLNMFFAHLPGASFDFRISLLWLVIYYLVLGVIIFVRLRYLIDLKRA